MRDILAMRRLFIIFGLFCPSFAQEMPSDFNTSMMQSTFLIKGPAKGEPGRTSFGTVFLLAIPLKDNPTKGIPVLVTAAHVLDGIAGDFADVLVRTKNDDGSYTTKDSNLRIRENGTAVYVKHDTADVAVLLASLPPDLKVRGLPTNLLADDARVKELQLHPGDEVTCLGYPLTISVPGGFPILRTGRIASYPLTPANVVKKYVFDIMLYPGNSGGPVYFMYIARFYGGTVHAGEIPLGILGLVSQMESSNLPGFTDKQLNIGIIVPAQFIIETLDKLPPHG